MKRHGERSGAGDRVGCAEALADAHPTRSPAPAGLWCVRVPVCPVGRGGGWRAVLGPVRRASAPAPFLPRQPSFWPFFQPGARATAVVRPLPASAFVAPSGRRLGA